RNLAHPTRFVADNSDQPFESRCAQSINASTRPLSMLQTEHAKESIKYECILGRHRRRPKGRRDGNSAMTTFSWNNPYAWPRKPLLAQNVVATSQPLAAHAGVTMLTACV